MLKKFNFKNKFIYFLIINKKFLKIEIIIIKT